MTEFNLDSDLTIIKQNKSSSVVSQKVIKNFKHI